MKKIPGKKVDAPEEHKFIGFNSYKKATDCLCPGDVAILAALFAFRGVHFTNVVKKGLNIFMEMAVDVKAGKE